MKKILNRPLKVLLVTNALILAAGAMLGPIYALFVTEIGGDLLDAGLAGAAFAFAAGITVLISATFADKTKESKTILVFGYAVMALGFFLYTQVTTMTMLLVVQLLIGFGEALYAPAFDGLYSRHLSKHKQSRQWGVWEAMYYFVTAGAAALGAYLVTTYGFNILFVIMGCLATASAVYLFFVPKKTL